MSVRYMPYPIHDALPCMKVSTEKTEAVMKRIQELIYRNSLPKKTSTGQQAFRLQQVCHHILFILKTLNYSNWDLYCLQGFLLSSAQQTVDKLINQTLEGVKMLKKSEQDGSMNDAACGEVISHAENLIQDSEKAKQV